jgi:hypothetical protein
MAQVIIPQSVAMPPAETELFVVRGDVLEFAMGFGGVPDIAQSLNQHRLRIVFRARQDDNLPNILVSQATLEARPDDTFKGQAIDVMASFVLSPQETQQIPARGCVYFIEWTDVIGGSNRRVVQGRVNVED